MFELVVLLLLGHMWGSIGVYHVPASPTVSCMSAGADEGSDSRHHKCSGYGTKQSEAETPIMLELWGLWSTISLPSLPSPLWPGVVVPDRVLSLGQIELFDI